MYYVHTYMTFHYKRSLSGRTIKKGGGLISVTFMKNNNKQGTFYAGKYMENYIILTPAQS